MESNKFACVCIAALIAATAHVSPVGAQTLSVSNVWYPVTITFDGPAASETASTFRNNRMNVTFTKGAKSYLVPGYFAADGNAAETSATSGNKWRVKFTPDEAGLWNYSVSFRTGTDIAASTAAGTAGSLDGVSGSFTVGVAAPGAPGFYAKGMLKYVGEHFLQFAGSGEWFVKGGPGSPEDWFGYEDFDGTFDAGGSQNDASLGPDGLHAYAAHTNHWQGGDPTWQGGKGKGIIGAINYLASIGMNTLYNVILTHNGDANTTWPWTTNTVKDVYDVSKLDQWDIVLTHMDAKGINNDLYLGESENTKYLNNGDLGVERKIFYRELMARFGHHLGWRWDIGEEPSALSTAQIKAISDYLHSLDAYNRAVGAHCSGQKSIRDPLYTPLLGYTNFDAAFSQINEDYHVEVLKWITESAAAGHKWVVPLDEPNYIAPTDAAKVREGFWKVVTAGGEGFDLYVAYDDPAYSDITVEDFSLMSAGLAPLRHGLQFFYLPEVNPHLPDMVTMDNLMSPTANTYCFAESGVIYVIYSKTPAGMTLNLAGASGTFEVRWFDPRNGGALQNGTVTTVAGGATRSLGNPPSATTSEWVALVSQPVGFGVNAGPDQNRPFPPGTNQVVVNLVGNVSSPGGAVTSVWSQVSGPGTVTFANSNAPVTTATLTGNSGAYVLQLAASSATTDASDTMTVNVSAYVPDTTPPAVQITSPTNNAAFPTGSVFAVTASITDAVGVQTGELYVDGVFQNADATPPYSWNVTGLSAGAHTLAVRGVDTATNTATNSISITLVATPPAMASEVLISDTFDGSAQTGIAAPLTYTNTGIDVPSSGTLSPSLANNSAPAGSLSVSVIYTGGLTGTLDFDGSYSFSKNGAPCNFGASLAGRKWALTFTAKTTGTTAVDKFFVGVSDTNACLIESDFDVAIQMGSGAATNDGQGIKVLSNGNAKKNVPNATTPISGNTLHTYVLTVDETGATPNYTLQMDGTNMLTANTSFGAFATSNRYVVFNVFDRASGAVNVGQMDEITLEVFIPPDIAPPVVNILSPTNGQAFYVGQSIPVSVSATDNVGVLEVSLFLDNLTRFVDVDDTLPYDFTVTGLNAGIYQLLAVANDNSLNESIVTNQIVVLNLPLLQTGQMTNGQFSISWNAPGFMLQAAPTVTGTWTNVVPSPASPYLVNPSGAAGFYRLQYPAP